MIWSLLFFVYLSNSISFNPSIVHIDKIPPTNSNYSNITNVGYIIFVHRAEQCPHCIHLGPTWNLAAEMGEGLAIFSELNCVTNEEICRKLRVYSVPSIIYYFNESVSLYRGYRIPREIVNWVSQFTSNESISIVDHLNFSKYESTRRIAILFSDKKEIPKIWIAANNVLNRFNQDKQVLFLFSRDKQLFKNLNLSTFPGIYFSNNGKDFFEYQGKRLVARIVDFMRNHIKLHSDSKAEL